MRSKPLLWLVVVLGCAAVIQARPSPPEAHLAIVFPATTTARGDVPVSLHFTFATDEEHTITSDSIMFVLLDDCGNQAAQEVFIPIDLPQKTTSKERDVSIQLKLRWDPYIAPAISLSRKYQLVCTCKSLEGALAGSAWFTVVKEQ